MDGLIRVVGARSSIEVPTGAVIVDCGDATIAPGFVDVHIHGSGGDTAMDGADAISRISRFLPLRGVTSWLPTLTPRASLSETVEVVRDSLASAPLNPIGASVLGLHLEGPFLNPKRPGAIRSEWFRSPSIEDLRMLLAAGNGRIRLMTLAPELAGGLDLVRALTAHGVVASIGHTDASAAEAAAAMSAGVSHATHTFNAMRGFHHRDPGAVGAVLTSDSVWSELIADGVHVDPLAMQILIRSKGAQRVALITDAVAPAGLDNGVYEFEGRPIDVQDGRATLADGTIAGSVSTFDANLRRVVQDCGVALQQAMLMASTAPARSVGFADRKGSLANGRDADLVVLDRDLQVRLTMVRGEIAHNTLGESAISRRI